MSPPILFINTSRQEHGKCGKQHYTVTVLTSISLHSLPRSARSPSSPPSPALHRPTRKQRPQETRKEAQEHPSPHPFHISNQAPRSTRSLATLSPSNRPPPSTSLSPPQPSSDGTGARAEHAQGPITAEQYRQSRRNWTRSSWVASSGRFRSFHLSRARVRLSFRIVPRTGRNEHQVGGENTDL